MRQFKFRVWDVSRNRMWYPGVDSCKLIIFGTGIGWGLYDSEMDNRLVTGDPNAIFNTPGVLMQAIGQKDGKGIEIFEGDILLYDIHRADRAKTICVVGYIEEWAAYGPIKTAPVKQDSEWDEQTSSFDLLHDEHSAFPEFAETEIIGNIYQKPNIVPAP